MSGKIVAMTKQNFKVKFNENWEFEKVVLQKGTKDEISKDLQVLRKEYKEAKSEEDREYIKRRAKMLSVIMIDDKEIDLLTDNNVVEE